MSTAPDRDRDIERLLRQVMPSAAQAPSADCLDAEALAAWADAGLDERARQAAESHVANCARCQAVVATLVRIEPAPPAVIPWWRASMVRWLAPAALVTAAATLWIALPAPSPLAPREEIPAQARQQAPGADEGVTAPVPEAFEAVRGPLARANRPLAATPATGAQTAPAPAAKVEADAAKDTATSFATPSSPAPLASRPAMAPRDESFITGAVRAPASEAPPVAAGNPAFAPAPSPESKERTQELRRMAGGAAGATAAQAVVAQAGQDARHARAFEVAAPDAGERWRVIGPAIEHTVDGGRTWEPLPVPGDAALTAGASPSRGVCWMVGRGGAVLRTTDGERWTRVTPPVITDLVAIDARDARTATVTTADGRRFFTTDAGATWQMQ